MAAEHAHTLVTLTPVRPGFPGDLTPHEQAVVDAHFLYVKSLVDDGRVLFAGRTLEDPVGLILHDDADLDAVRALTDADPVVREGLMRATVQAFRLALYR